MLTPVDIQQKKFRIGIGYDKKDVLAFFKEVSKSYEELYRSNAELKDKVITLNDALQHYKTTEENLQKSLMLAEKNSQESKSNAAREAKAIELEAKNRANEIVSQAYTELEEMEKRMTELESRYAEYKSGFYSIVVEQMNFLNINDFDPEAVIDPTYAQMMSVGRPVSSSVKSDITFDFSDDPQMRDHSTLGGGETILPKEMAQSSTLSVYGSKLGGEDGVDPFKIKDDTSKKSDGPKEPVKPSGLKMVNEKQKLRPNRFAKPADTTKSESGTNFSTNTAPKANSPQNTSQTGSDKSDVKASKSSKNEDSKMNSDVKNKRSEDDSFVGDVESAKAAGKVMLGDGDTGEETFEFIEE